MPISAYDPRSAQARGGDAEAPALLNPPALPGPTRVYRGEVASEAAMLSLSPVNVSDWVKRTDLGGQVFELVTAGPSVLANWALFPVAAGGGVTDGDKVDINVAGGGATWTVKSNVVSNSKLADVPTSTIKGRVTAATGDPEDLTPAQVRTLINVADGATANSSDATLLARANHTGTQTAATISDFSTAADARITAQKGLANGLAPLGADSKIAATYLPSYVDDVHEYANLAGFPGTGETAKIYVALDTNRTYRWSGSAYVEISASPGSTDAVIEGATNLYHTAARVRATDLTGLSTADSSDVAATDSVLSAFGKIQAKWNGIAATVRGTVLTGYAAAAASALAATDSVLGAFNKIGGFINLFTGGTTGQVIKKNSATAFDFGWGTDDAGGVVASQAEAEAGTENTKMMTPLRTRQALDAYPGLAAAELNVATTLQRATHGNRPLWQNQAGALTHTIDDDAAGGWNTVGDAIAIANRGAGVITIQGDGTSTVAAPTGFKLTIAQNEIGTFERVAANTWVSTTPDQLDTVSQAEAEAGTATTRRAWTAQRVSQAIAALGGGSAPNFLDGNSWTMHARFNDASIQPLGVLGSQFQIEGTAAAVNTAFGSIGQWNRVRYTATAGANANAGWRSLSGGHQFYPGANALTTTKHRFVFSVADANTAGRVIAGILTGGTPTTTEPSAQVDCIFVGADSTDTNLQVMHNDASGACTKINLGANFPANSNAVDMIDFRIKFNGGASRSIDYWVINHTNGATASGSITTDLPTAGEQCCPGIVRNSAADATNAASMLIVGLASGSFTGIA